MGEKTVKRRAPYALRACNACRRRKGKCDGCQPCQYCKSRGQACRFAAGAGLVDEWRDVPIALSAGDDDSQAQQPSSANPFPPSQEATLLEMVSNLQNQVNNLASRVHMSSEAGSQMSSWSFPLSKTANEDGLSEGPAESTPNSEPGRGFYGPTSPDFSLNMAQMNMRQRSFSEASPHRPQLASIDDEPVSDNEGSPRASDGSIAHGYNSWSRGEQGYRSRLSRFKSLLSLKEVLRLLLVYQEVVGDFHPIVDLGHLMKRTRAWYNDNGPESCDGSVASIDSDTDEDDMLILNIALAIALNTEPDSMSHNPEALLQSSFQDAVNARIVCPQPSIKHATIVLLVGIYYFFQDMPRNSWRMCGIAGRMLMEMGFHNGDILDHILDSEEKRSAASTIMSSILVLDRQWSSATGLPSNFKNSSFDSIQKSLIKTPYLKAMLAFILISDKFGEPLSRAAKGEKYDDSDAFEVMNFQVDQWRKKAIDEESRKKIDTWHSDSSSSVRPPSWAIILSLRAESVRSMMLRPCFFSDSDIETGKRHLRPAMDLVSNVVNVLWRLDATTDIYRKQRPYYQHLLASVSALLFLLISYVEQHKSQLSTSLPDDFAEFVGETFRKALYLAEVHARSRASRRLFKRLSEMRNALIKLAILPASSQPGAANSRQPTQSPTNATRAARGKAPTRSDTQDLLSGALTDYPEPFDLMAIDPQLEADLTATLNDDLQLGSAESLLFQWPLNEDSGFFLDAGFYR